MSPLVLILILILVFGAGGWGWHSSGYVGGPYLGGGLGLVLLLLLVWLLLGGRA